MHEGVMTTDEDFIKHKVILCSKCEALHYQCFAKWNYRKIDSGGYSEPVKTGIQERNLNDFIKLTFKQSPLSNSFNSTSFSLWKNI